MSLRLRLALLVTAAAAVVVVGGAALFLHVLTDGLRHSLDSGLAGQAEAVATVVKQSHRTLRRSALASADEDRYRIQVIDPQGKIAATNRRSVVAPLVGRTPIDRLLTQRHSSTVDVAQRRVRIQPVRHGGQRWLVLVATEDNTDETVDRVRNQLLVAGAAIVVLAGIATWLIAGATLRPVERLRRQVAAHPDQGGARHVSAAHGDVLDVPRTGDEIAALARTLNDVLRRLDQARDRERSFVADASHELRTPLAIVAGELELARRPGRSSSDLRAAVKAAAEETSRLQGLAEDLLLLARADQGAALARLEPTRPVQILEEAVSARQSTLATDGVEARVHGDPALEVPADPRRLRQVVDNLLANAQRAAPAGSAIDLAVTADGDQWELSVADRGGGFPPELIERAFDRFATSPGPRAEPGGAGLGLAIVASLVRAHGGDVWAQNRPDGGAIVAARIPRRPGRSKA